MREFKPTVVMWATQAAVTHSADHHIFTEAQTFAIRGPRDRDAELLSWFERVEEHIVSNTGPNCKEVHIGSSVMLYDTYVEFETDDSPSLFYPGVMPDSRCSFKIYRDTGIVEIVYRPGKLQ